MSRKSGKKDTLTLRQLGIAEELGEKELKAIERIDKAPLEKRFEIKEDKELSAERKREIIKWLIRHRAVVTCPRGYLLQFEEDLVHFKKLEWNG